jgi:hypothetical protein
MRISCRLFMAAKIPAHLPSHLRMALHLRDWRLLLRDSCSRRFSRTFPDTIASIGIALILMIVAALLGNEARGLLVGEGARKSTVRKICELVEADPAVEAAGRPLTMYHGPDTVLLALDVRFRRTLSAGDYQCS